MLRFFKRVTRRDLCRAIATLQNHREMLRSEVNKRTAERDAERQTNAVYRETIDGLENEIAVKGREISSVWSDHCIVVDRFKMDHDSLVESRDGARKHADKLAEDRNGFHEQRDRARESRDGYAKDVIELREKLRAVREAIS